MTGIGPFGPGESIFRPSEGVQASITPSILGGPNEFGGPPEAPVADKPGLRGIETGGNVLAIAGLVTQAIGNF